MKLLFVLPHYFAADGTPAGSHGSNNGSARDRRATIVRQTIACLHQTFGAGQAFLQIADREIVPANQSVKHDVHVVAVTCGDHHLLGGATHHDDVEIAHVDGDPMELGFAAHDVLRDRAGDYDFLCYMEDDLWIRDPAWFQKLIWFNQNTDEASVLLPHRYELRSNACAVRKLYVDGDLAPRVTASFQNLTDQPHWDGRVMGHPVRWTRTLNPHSGCFFLNAAQAKRWIDQPYFGNRDRSFVGPLESAATLSIAKTFRVYKPAVEHASFLELEHADRRFIHYAK